MGDGDGWAVCGDGHRHWGRYGAAGLMLYHSDASGETHVLLQQRAWWTVGGRTWGLLGGARHSHEDVVAAALREAGEESTLDTASVRPHGVLGQDHGGWSYATVVASTASRAPVEAASLETRDVAWVPVDEVEEMRLFGPFAADWPRLRTALVRLVIVVDGANVVGSRPDGWWRDRAGAAVRLRDRLAGLTSLENVPEDAVPFEVCYPEIVLVVEGAARGVGAGESGVRVVSAAGSGDDAIVAVARDRAPDERCLVVTADRELRERCHAVGASVTGPRRLLDLLD